MEHAHEACEADGSLRIVSLRRLSCKVMTLAKLHAESEEGVAALIKFHSELFGRDPRPAQEAHEHSVTASDVLFGDYGLSCGEVLDYMMTISVNTSPGCVYAYSAMYWSVQLLLVLREAEARRLQAALVSHGFVFSTDAGLAVHQMRTHKRRPSLTERIVHAATQLQVAINRPAERVYAGLYNSIVVRCRLPVNLIHQTTMQAICAMVVEHHARARHRRDIDAYMDTHFGGSRSHAVAIDGYPGVLSVYLDDHISGTVPVMTSIQTRTEMLLRCAQELLPGYRSVAARRNCGWEWYRDRYLVAKPSASARALSPSAPIWSPTRHSLPVVRLTVEQTTMQTSDKKNKYD